MDLCERTRPGAPRHPWEVAKCAFFLSILGHTGLLSSAGRWLDVGAGDAWFAQQLIESSAAGSSVTCWDANYSDFDLESIASGDEILPIRVPPTGVFDGIVMLDVLEHVLDDVSFLKLVVTDHLSSDGKILISVPAHQRLFSDHDVFLNHHRRYSRKACLELFERSDLRVEQEGGVFHSLALARAAAVVLERLPSRPQEQSGVGKWDRGRSLTSLVTSVLNLEARGSRWLSDRDLYLPGLSYWALCCKPGL